MPTTAKQWHLLPFDPQATRRLASTVGVSELVAQLLLNRGVSEPNDARRFLDCSLLSLHSPQLLPGVPEAADRIHQAIKNHKSIRIYGDYDTDGVTGTAILVKLIEKLGGKVDYFIPHRLDHGYGLNTAILDDFARDNVQMLVTVDCGITAIEAAAEARRLGIELIITDHHEMLDTLPDADVVVHPCRPDGNYPFAGLSGAGVAFKLAWAIAQNASGSERVTTDLREFLLDMVGLAALGLVADVVPLRDENRIYVKHGLTRLAAKPSMGLRALIEASKLEESAIRAEDVSFRLAPRLNAAGRLGCALLVVDLLTTKSPARARELAECLEGFNTKRQTLERKIASQARTMIETEGHSEHPAIVLGSEEWHPGVIGIVAGRLTEQFARPVVLVALKPDDAASTGSGRSIPQVPLHEVLRACDACLEGHGGHAMAAGVKVRPSKLAEFRETMIRHVSQAFPNGLPAPRLRLDAEVPLSSLSFSLIADIDRLEPFGADNPRPRFLATNLVIDGTPRKIGKDERHLSLQLRQGNTAVRAVAFGMAERLEELMSDHGRCCVAFSPKINEWNGRRSVQIEIIDFRAGMDVELV